MNITIFGSGYVGLVTGACLAEVGNQVMCVDVDRDKIDRLNRGEIPIHEPGLETIIQRNLANQRIQFTTDSKRAVNHARIQMIAVGTPPDEDGSADLQYVVAVAKEIASLMQDDKIVVTKSTVPVGTADKVAKTLRAELNERGSELGFAIASNPEFLKEGAAVADFMKPDRIIIGVDSDLALDHLSRLYAPFNRNHDRIVSMDVRSAEMTKYAANAMLATKISFMNELANLAEQLGVDIEKVRLGIGSDPRIGYHFIYPGCGFGGSCFPKDIRALGATARQIGYPADLLQAVEQVNNRQKTKLFEKITNYFANDLRGKHIALWGLAFKPNTDDMREASSRVLMEALWDAGARVTAYDPVAMVETKRIYQDQLDKGQLRLAGTAMEATVQADALVIVTEWTEFRSPDLPAVKANLRHPVIFDGRNVFEPEQIKQAGFHYYAIGRGDSVTLS